MSNKAILPEFLRRNAFPVLEARKVRKTYSTHGQRIEVLKEINLTVEKGQTIAIVGASGVGKSTLLHLLGLLERPDEGSVLYDGQEVGKLDDNELAIVRNQYVGFVFQFHHLLPEFSAAENVMIPALIARIDKKKALEMAKVTLALVGLQDRMKHRVGMLSGGEQQRVALARAVVMDPKLLLADEPTGNLDTHTGQKVHDLILELGKKNQMATVLVTHNLALARSTDHCMTIMDGFLKKADFGRDF